MRRVILIITYLITGLLFSQSVMAERMVTDLSRHIIEITSEFSGTQLWIFGCG